MRVEWLVAVGLLASSSAVADPTPLDAADGPGFVNLQRFDATSRAGIETVRPSRGEYRRWELHAQVVEPSTRAGGYVSLPYAVQDTIDDFGSPVTRRSIGNLVVGGLWIPRLSTPHLALVLHAGIAVPLDDDEPLLGALGNLTRPHALYGGITDATSGQLGTSLLARSGDVFARVDAGLDVLLSTDTRAFDSGRAPAIHANAGVGFDTGAISIGLEASTLMIVSDQPASFLSSPPDSFTSIDVLAATAISVRYRRPYVQAYIALASALRDQQQRYYSGALAVGVEGALR